MDYQGVIIEESLGDKSVLKDVRILYTEIEAVTLEHKTLHLKGLLYTAGQLGDVFVERYGNLLQTVDKFGILLLSKNLPYGGFRLRRIGPASLLTMLGSRAKTARFFTPQ